MQTNYRNKLIGSLAAVTVLSLYIILFTDTSPQRADYTKIVYEEDFALRAPVVSTLTNANILPAPPQPDKMSYAEAREAYPLRLQFVDCHGQPGSINVGSGGQIMLDNRDDVSHRIAVGNQAFTIPAFDFAIATAGSAGGHYVTCDSGGAARLYVY